SFSFSGHFPQSSFLPLPALFLSVGLVLKFAARFGGKVESVILAGVTINIFCAALILMIRYAVDPSRLVVMDRWLMGGLDVVGWENILALIPFVFAAAILLFPLGSALDLMAFDAGFAEAQGVPLKKVRMKICAAVGLWVGASVAVSGPIGFVGLVVPQIIRRISGSNMRQALVFSALGGGIFLAGCDMLARSISPSSEMPVGIITAMIGGPLFLRILWRRSGI
ncbi:iron ABC transporter permease, partial [Desulfococcaceae bacterium OttesenSCG-928-F15]|nr:iron ABC transporter permease [Desulfococcaceae bacterium OttesenSCG-928-F15]